MKTPVKTNPYKKPPDPPWNFSKPELESANMGNPNPPPNKYKQVAIKACLGVKKTQQTISAKLCPEIGIVLPTTFISQVHCAETERNIIVESMKNIGLILFYLM